MGDITANLVCRFAFDEASGSTALDAGSEGIHATINGAARAAGKIGSGSVTFSNLAHNVNRPAPIAGTTNQLTVACWVNATAAGVYPIIVCCCPSAADKGWVVHLDNATGKPFFFVTNAPGSRPSVTSNGASIVNAGWKHIACVYNGVDLRIYVDGVLSCVPVAVTGNIYFGADTLAARVGNAPASTGFPFTGSVDDVRIYNRALSQADITDLFAYTEPTMVVDDVTAGRIMQRTKGTRYKTVTLSGTCGPNTRTVDVQLLVENSTTVALNWTALANMRIGGGAWAGDLVVPQGGMFNIQARGKDASGAVVETSTRCGHPWGVGICVAWLGQSNWANMFANTSGTLTPHASTRMYFGGTWATVTGDGAINAANSMRAGSGLPIGLIAGAVGGSTIANWIDTTGSSVYSAFLTAATAAGGDFELVSYQQGEQDAVNLTPAATYKAGLTTLYANLRTFTGRTVDQLPFSLVLLGNINHTSSTDASTQAIRQAHQEWIGTTTGAVFGGSAVDMVQNDGFHWTTAYNARMGLRNAQANLAGMGYTTYGARGPRVHHATLSGLQITVSIVHDSGGTSLKDRNGSTAGTNLTGFKLTDNSGALAIASTAFDGNTILLGLGRAAVGTPQLYYQYGENPDVTNGVFDDTSPNGDTLGLPLQPTIGAITVKIGASSESILETKTTSGLTLYAITATGIVARATEDGGSKAGWYSVIDADWIAAGLPAGRHSVAFMRGDWRNPKPTDEQIGPSTEFGWDGSQELAVVRVNLENELGGLAAASDFDDDSVPPERTWVVKQGRGSDDILTADTLRLALGTAPKFAVDFRGDLPVGGSVKIVDTPTIYAGTSGGVTFSTTGREDSQAKVRITGIVAGTYVLEFVVTYDNGDTQKARVPLKVVN